MGPPESLIFFIVFVGQCPIFVMIGFRNNLYWWMRAAKSAYPKSKNYSTSEQIGLWYVQQARASIVFLFTVQSTYMANVGLRAGYFLGNGLLTAGAYVVWIVLLAMILVGMDFALMMNGHERVPFQDDRRDL